MRVLEDPRSNLKKKFLARINEIGSILMKKKRMLSLLMKGPKKLKKSRRSRRCRRSRRRKLKKKRRNPILRCPSSTPSRSM